jgi:hypothetical protein
VFRESERSQAVRRSSLRVVLGAVALAAAVGARADEPSKEVPALRAWDGVVQDESLKGVAAAVKAAGSSPASGYVANEKEFLRMWTAWRPGEKAPTIDFETEVVLVGVTPGPNRVSLVPKLDEKGDLRVHVRTNLVEGKGFGYGIVTVKRAGIKTVNGKPIVKE